jgi:2-polyprenyl-6-methoxyphenol hydroxylase-like FAD-dependent oxidoreductase
VDVFESKPEFGEIGASLTIWPNALAALDALGVGGGARAQALTEYFDGGFMTPSGEWLSRLSTEEVRKHVGEVTILTRPDLLSLLLEAVPSSILHAGTAVERVELDGTVWTAEDTLQADLVVAADGVRSRVRETLWPDAARPHYSGFTAKRFNTVPLDEPVPDGAWVWDKHRSFGYTPLTGGRAYAFAIERAYPGGTSTDLSMYADSRDPIPRLCQHVGEGGVLRHDILEVPRLRSYVAGKVALVGDSAHAMQPSLGQGACTALEDAVMIGRCAEDLPRYDKVRRWRTRRIVRTSNLIMRAAHWSSPVAVGMRNISMAAVPAAVNMRMLALDWGWTPGPALAAPPVRAMQ